MIERVVAEHTCARDGDGLDGLRRIGIDEVAYRKGHRYLISWVSGMTEASSAHSRRQCCVERMLVAQD